MSVPNATLIHELETVTQQIITDAQALLSINIEALQHRPNPSSWNALECIAHLNIYCLYYMPAISNKIAAANKQIDTQNNFKSGWLGNYFTKLMQVHGKPIKKMQAPKSANPIHNELGKDAIITFINYQHQLLGQLKLAYTVDLSANRIPTALSKLIKLSLGDTMQFFIYHNQRHLLQAHNAIPVYA